MQEMLNVVYKYTQKFMSVYNTYMAFWNETLLYPSKMHFSLGRWRELGVCAAWEGFVCRGINEILQLRKSPITWSASF